MDLSDALPGGTNQSQGTSQWPGGQPGQWPGGQPGQWPGGQPSQWPGGQSGPAAGNSPWPSSQPASNPSWQPSQPGQPGTNHWPGSGGPGQPGPQPSGPGPNHWPASGGPGQPGPQPSGPGAWPSPASGPGAWPSPASGPGPAPAPTPNFPVAPQQILKVPHSQSLPSGVFDKELITIAGTIKPNAEKITVDLSHRSDVAFHVATRFNDCGKKVIVRNTRISNNWGKEERDIPHFPFTQGRPFEMKILCTNSGYRVAVDGKHLFEYQHRVKDLRSIKAFLIHGDLTLSSVRVETLP